MPASDFHLVYMTAASADEAARIGRQLVEERLAACVNLIDGMRAIYHWQGKICDDRECVLLAKTRADLVGALTRRVKELHSYECPCIVSLSLATGAASYLDWLQRETQPPETGS